MAKHPNKHIREAVKYAIARGWTLTRPCSHAWGMLWCPHSGRDGCRQAIHSTPRNPEAHAKDIRRAVEHCPHVHS